MKRELVIVLCLLSASAGAQSEKEPDRPKTKMEAFAGQDGIVLVRGYSKVGQIKGNYGALVTVDVREFLNATSGKREVGIAVQVTEAGRIPAESTSYVDFDEIPSLIKGLEYIAKLDKSATVLDNVEADYSTKGDLVVGTFSEAAGKMSAIVKSGRIRRASAFVSLEDLGRLREIVQAALTKLDELRTIGSVNK